MKIHISNKMTQLKSRTIHHRTDLITYRTSSPSYDTVFPYIIIARGGYLKIMHRSPAVVFPWLYSSLIQTSVPMLSLGAIYKSLAFRLYSYLLILMKLFCEDDGWQNHDHEQQRSTLESSNPLRYHFKQAAREVLDSHHHSLEPDMVFGWRPKLPSCPLPLTYANPYTDALLAHLPTDDRFRLVFLGPRPSNSVQLNQQFDYVWRYRSRYNSNLTAVREAIRRVGENGKRYQMDLSPGDVHFDSAFECGNLDMAVRVKRNEFDLFLRSDTNTRGHTSWYYFKVNNRDLTGDVQFNICNFGKRKNLYASGLKPYELREGGEWRQEGCFEVCWVERICRYGFERKAFQLQFKYNFREKNQTVYFAYSIPYSYSRLQRFIGELTAKGQRCVEQSKLTETLGGLEVPLLTITNRSEEENSDSSNCEEVRKKKVVLVTGRIHPGEPHSSFILEGLMRFLASEDPMAVMLRSNFVFHVVPMLNPDGVVAGNFRTSFSGKDLNRQFNRLSKYVFPEITALHELAMQLKRAHRSALQFYFDFHAHSSKKGLFCYGPEHPPGKTEYFKSRALAKLIQQKSPIFSYLRSIFTVSEAKRDTSRAHMLWKIKIPMSFTFEVSNGLYDTREAKYLPLYEKHLQDLGQAVAQGFFRYGQLEMRLPTMKAKAKVDTGIKKRSGGSAKEFRKSSSKPAKIMTIKELQTKDSSTEVLREKKDVSLHEILLTEEGKVERSQDKDDFLRILREIKREESEQKYKPLDEYEGGSDSESEGEDLEEEDLARLHKIIETRNESTKSYSKGFLQWKSQTRKDVLRKKSESQDIKENYPTIQELPKKPATSKYLQAIKLAALPPRSKRVMLPQSEKIVLAARNFALDL